MTDFRFNDQERRLSGPLGTVVLRPKVAELLGLLSGHHPSVVGKPDCLTLLWPDTHVEPRALAQVVVELRKSIQAVGGSRDWIITIPKSGYRLLRRPRIDDVQVAAETSQIAPTKSNPVPRPTTRRVKGGLLTAMITIICLLLGFAFVRSEGPAVANSRGPRLAVLPIAGSDSPATRWLTFAYPELLTQALGQSGLVETVSFEQVYDAMAGESAKMPAPAEDPFARLKTALGVDTFVQIDVQEQEGSIILTVSLNAPSAPQRFSFMTSDPGATIPTVATRLLEALGRKGPPVDVYGNPFLNEIYAKGHRYFLKGEYKQAQPYLQVCYDQRPDTGRHIYHLAKSYIYLREYDAAEKILTHALPDADGLYLQAELSFAKRQFARCETQLKALLAQERVPRRLIASAHGLLGTLLTITERSDLGRAHFQKAITLFKTMGNLQSQVKIMHAQLRASQYLGLGVETRSWRELIDLARLLQHGDIEARALAGLGDHYFNRRQWPEAYTAYEASMQLRREHNDALGIGICLSGMGTTATRMRRFTTAEQLLQEALSAYQALGDTYNQVNQHLNLGYLYLVQQRSATAEAEYRKAFALAGNAADTVGEAYALLGLAEVALQREDWQDMAELLDREEVRSSTHGPVRAGYKCIRAVLFYRRKDAAHALELMTEVRASKDTAGWHKTLQKYFDIYQAAVTTGIYGALPYETDPLQGPDT